MWHVLWKLSVPFPNSAPVRSMFQLLAETATQVPTQGTHPLVVGLAIFVLAVFVGFEIITKIPPTLHTPLMSGSNAISGVTLVGAVLASGAEQTDLATMLGLLAVIMATVNVVGGFLVTHRMLQKFRR